MIIPAISRNLIRIFLAAFLFFVNFFTVFTVIPSYTLFIGGNEFSIGLQSTVFFITGVILRFYFGPFADRYGKKIPLLIGAFVLSTSPLLLMMISDHWMLIPVRIYQGIALAAFLSNASSFVADITPEEKLGGYIGAYRMTITLALLTGPAAAQIIINSRGFDTWFLTSFITGFISFILIAPVKVPLHASVQMISPVRNIIMAVSNKVLWPIYFGVFLLSLGYGAIMSFASTYIAQVTTVSNPGIYFTIFAIAGALANVFAGFLSDRFGRAIVVWPSVILMALGSLSLYFLPVNFYFLPISGILCGIGYSGGITTLIAWLVDRSDQKIRATVLSFEESAIDSAMAVSSFIIGLATGFISLSLSFALLGTIILCFAIPLLISSLIAGTRQKVSSCEKGSA